MSEQEKQAAKDMAKALNKAMEVLPVNQQERVVGIAQGMALMAAKPETKQAKRRSEHHD